jgi:hypothetical protein
MPDNYKVLEIDILLAEIAHKDSSLNVTTYLPVLICNFASVSKEMKEIR